MAFRLKRLAEQSKVALKLLSMKCLPAALTAGGYLAVEMIRVAGQPGSAIVVRYGAPTLGILLISLLNQGLGIGLAILLILAPELVDHTSTSPHLVAASLGCALVGAHRRSLLLLLLAAGLGVTGGRAAFAATLLAILATLAIDETIARLKAPVLRLNSSAFLRLFYFSLFYVAVGVAYAKAIYNLGNRNPASYGLRKTISLWDALYESFSILVTGEQVLLKASSTLARTLHASEMLVGVAIIAIFLGVLFHDLQSED